MKTFKDIAAELNEQMARREQEFKDKHIIQKIGHPEATEDQFAADKVKKDKSKKASHHDGEDVKVYEEVEQIDEVMKLDKDNHVYHDHEAETFAKDYVKGFKGEYSPDGRSDKHIKDSDKFHSTYKRVGGKSGFAGSGTDIYQHKQTGAKYEIHRHANGRGFYGTDHRISKINEETGLDETKAYISSLAPELGRKGSHDVIGKDGKVVKSFPHTKDGMKAAQIHLSKIKEETMSDAEMKKREDIVKGMKKSKEDLKKRYGDRWKSVMYATATKNAMKESVGQIDESNNDAIAKDHEAVAKRHLNAYKENWKNSHARKQHEIAYNLHIDAAKAHKNNTHSPEQLKKLSDRAYNATDHIEKHVKESINLDELSKSTLASYAMKAHNRGDMAARMSKKSNGTYDKDMAHIANKRYDGVQRAIKKLAKEEYIDEAFKAGSMKLSDGSVVKVTSEEASVLNTLFNQLNSSNKTKMNERLMSDTKGFNEILEFAKAVI